MSSSCGREVLSHGGGKMSGFDADKVLSSCGESVFF